MTNAFDSEAGRLRQENAALRAELERLRGRQGGRTFRERYALRILDSLPDMLTVFDRNERCIEVVSNESANHMGIPGEKLRGMTLAGMVPPEAYHSIHDNMERVKATGKSSVSYHELGEGGARRYYENRIWPLDSGRLLVMCRDISGRVAMQRNLAMLKRALESVSDAVLGVTAGGQLVYANRQMRKDILGRTPCGQDVSALGELWHERTFAERIGAIRDSKGGHTYRTRLFSRNDGKPHFLQVSSFAMTNDSTDTFWFFAKDITDIVKSREEQAETNKLLDGILDNIPLYLFVKDAGDDMRYVYWNKALARASGIPACEVIGKTDLEIYRDKAEAERFLRIDRAALRSGEAVQSQESYVNRLGETHVAQTLETLVKRPGRAPLLVGISWDVTEMQDIEQELVRARIRAEQSDRLKSAFLANMSHEIRTPLNAIVGFSGLIAQAAGRGECARFAEIVKQNSDILLRLISDILDIAKVEAGTLDYIRQPMDLAKLCRQLYEIHRDRTRDGVSLVLDIPGGPAPIEGDRNRIQQVFTNLITNACKFTASGEVRFGFRMEEGAAHCFCRDTGIGIPRDKQQKVFERFVKLNAFARGTGLGLSICQMIVGKLGGRIWLESEPGRGSTFHFTIPTG